VGNYIASYGSTSSHTEQIEDDYPKRLPPGRHHQQLLRLCLEELFAFDLNVDIAKAQFGPTERFGLR
jgi:hypothetical protein